MVLNRHPTPSRLTIACLALLGCVLSGAASEAGQAYGEAARPLLLQDIDGNETSLASLRADQPLFVAALARPQDIEPAFRWITLVHSLPEASHPFRSALVYMEEADPSARRSPRAALPMLRRIVQSDFLRQQAFFGTAAADWPHGASLSFYLLDQRGIVRWSCLGYPSEEEWQRAVLVLSRLP